jgi:hypothetical protein
VAGRFSSPGAAWHAADACRAAAVALRDCTDERQRVAAEARVDWRGPHRDAFDDDLAALDGDAASIESNLMRLAGVLDEVAGLLRPDGGGGAGR